MGGSPCAGKSSLARRVRREARRRGLAAYTVTGDRSLDEMAAALAAYVDQALFWGGAAGRLARQVAGSLTAGFPRRISCIRMVPHRLPALDHRPIIPRPDSISPKRAVAGPGCVGPAPLFNP